MALNKRLFAFCGALPVVHVIFLFLATSKRVRQANRREFVPTTAVHKYICEVQKKMKNQRPPQDNKK